MFSRKKSTKKLIKIDVYPAILLNVLNGSLLVPQVGVGGGATSPHSYTTLSYITLELREWGGVRYMKNWSSTIFNYIISILTAPALLN